MARGTRLSGHALRGEGAPFVVNEDGEVVSARFGGWGRGLCECGAMSPVLASGSARRAWHRRHKDVLR